MERVFDEGLDRYCYHYADDDTYPAQVEIPWSFVTHVSLRAASTELSKKKTQVWFYQNFDGSFGKIDLISLNILYKPKYGYEPVDKLQLINNH